MKLSTETTARNYVFSEPEVRKALQIKGEIKKVEYINNEFTIATIEEKTPKESSIGKMLDSIGNIRIG